MGLPLPGEDGLYGALPEAPSAQTSPPEPPRTPPPTITYHCPCNHNFEAPKGTNPECPSCGVRMYDHQFRMGLQPEKPPLGLKPWFIVDEDRVNEILGAMERYAKAGEAIPAEWVVELKVKLHTRVLLDEMRLKAEEANGG